MKAAQAASPLSALAAPFPVALSAASAPVDGSAIGLYDHQGVLRCSGRDQAECLAYAELFDLDPEHCSLVSLN